MATLAEQHPDWSFGHGRGGRASPMQALVSFGTALLIIFLAATLGDYKSIPDWTGYERLYIADGGWLAESGRDPVFTWLLSSSLRTFGSNGYEAFRSSLIVYFIVVIGYLSWTCPRQKALPVAGSAVLIGLIAASMFATKALVQIREGLAFSALIFAVILTTRYDWRYLRLPVLALSILAVLTHSGLAIPAATLIGSWFIAYFVNTNNQIDHRFHRTVLVSCIMIGFVLALLMIRSPDLAREYFEGFVSERSDIESPGLGKYLYWSIMFACCFIIHRQSLAIDEIVLPRYGIACVYAFGSIMLPICFSITFGLIVFGFPDGTVIASFSRLLFTAMSLVSLIIIVLGEARTTLFFVSTFVLVDQIRIMLDNGSIG